MNDDPSNLLDRAASRLEPDVERLVAGGTARGRRLRRRRRIGSSLAAAAVVGVVAASAAVAPQLLGGDPDHGQVADGFTPIPSESVEPDNAEPSKPATSVAAGDGTPSVRAAELPGLVTSSFPGTVSDAPESTGQIMNGGERSQIAHFLWDGYLMTVGATASRRADPMAECEALSGDAMTCTKRPDGSVYSAWTQTGPAVDGGVTGRGVSLYVEGWEIFVVSYNAADGKDSPLLAEEPPFTYEELDRIISDQAWFD
ncbi:MAG: hypothetical protein Q7J48_03320 [Nocardioides sp.]|nr:hypothetical protein [Nocardioides sp.]